MNIPDGVIELTVVGVISFVFKVVVGLITKNEQKSDEADARITEEIKEHGQWIKNVDDAHKNNEHKIFDKLSDQGERIAHLEALIKSRT